MNIRAKHQIMHRLVAGSLLLSLLLTMLPTNASADEGTYVFIPVVNNGESSAGETEDPDAIEEALMAEARIQLPDPKTIEPTNPVDPAANDLDGDGVPNDEDNCPFQPNPPQNGEQDELCGAALGAVMDDLVFLMSRIFPPTVGLDPALRQTQPKERIHALLHVNQNENRVVLHSDQRQLLEQHGVVLLGYLPHYTYYVSLPRNIESLQQIVGLEVVSGITAIRPGDKVAPQVRLRGPFNGRNGDGTFSFHVNFHSDVPADEIEATLNRYGLPFEHQYDATYRITLSTWEQLRRLVIQDMTHWIDDIPDEPKNHTTNAQRLIGADIVSRTLGYRGQGIVLSMTEAAFASPPDHPDMDGRITEGNNPFFLGTIDPKDIDHAQMVSAIMIADETSFPENRGILPEAKLITYSYKGVIGLKRTHYGIPKEAREDHGALLSNNSWGMINCPKRGTYSLRGKFYDRAVYDVGVLIITSAGNARGPNGDFATETPFWDCEPDLYSLPHPVAKNDISVGNWSITDGMLDPTSSAGPSSDGRLKPDLIAPGQGIDTVDYIEASNVVTPDVGSGTSAAAPVVSGVVGLLAESFENQGEDSLSIAPARYKAILIHTAEDKGPPGPDYRHGYGLIQADKALRIAEEWSDWGREGTLDDDQNTTTPPELVFPFTVSSPLSYFKATLVWDDEEGESQDMVLKNDLDLTLTLVNPSNPSIPAGDVFYPWDLALPVGATTDDGSVPCTNPDCQDRVNNVEQVFVESPYGDFVPQGDWEARVKVNRLESAEQSFSLVLTPPCPVHLNKDATLLQDIDCQPHILEPRAVSIEADGVELNGDNYSILGNDATFDNFSGTWVGIRSHASDVTIRNCLISGFDVGISVEEDEERFGEQSGNVIEENELFELGSAGVKLEGDNHRVQFNDISNFVWSEAKGIFAYGDNLTVKENQFHSAMKGGGTRSHTVAVDVILDSEDGAISDNGFSGYWMQGIRLRSGDAAYPVQNMTISGNHFEGINQTPIMLLGNVHSSTVTDNVIRSYGDGFPGISVINNQAGFQPQFNTVSDNDIFGSTGILNKGIRLREALRTKVLNNTIDSAVIGIVEEEATGTVIQANQITTNPGSSFRADIGIRSLSSEGLAGEAVHIFSNTIVSAVVGIEVTTPVSASVDSNSIDYTDTGIDIDGGGVAVTVSNNTITPNILGVDVRNSPAAVVRKSSIDNRRGGSFSGIILTNSDGALIGSNGVTAPATGISVSASVGVSVTDNGISDPGTTGIYLDAASRAFVNRNNVTINEAIGIQYASGNDAVISYNEVDSLFSGVGIRLGDGSFPGCVVDVDNILVQDNDLTGGTATIEQLCDVGTVTLINN